MPVLSFSWSFLTLDSNFFFKFSSKRIPLPALWALTYPKVGDLSFTHLPDRYCIPFPIFPVLAKPPQGCLCWAPGTRPLHSPAFERRCFYATPLLGWITFITFHCLFWEELGVLPLQRLLVECNSSWVSWNESLAHLALAQYSRSLAEAAPAALLLMGIETLFRGQHQKIRWDQLFWLSVIRSCSVTAIKYLKTTAKPWNFPVREDTGPEYWGGTWCRLQNCVFLLYINQHSLKREIKWLLKFQDLCLEALEMTFLSDLAGLLYEV